MPPHRPVSPKSRAPLTRYLLYFDRAKYPRLVTFGVTAFSIDDACELVREYWHLDETPEPSSVDSDVDLSTIPDDWWKAMVGPTNWRGVWYPYQQLE
jgi:hypothetical protein